MAYKYSLFYWILLLICISFKAYGGNIFIDCGSQSNTIIGDRLFMADKYSSKYLTTSNQVLSNCSVNNNSSLLYKTARIFNGKTTYKLPIGRVGRYFIRLHFFPFTNKSFDLRKSKFWVSIGRFLVLRDFTPPQYPVVREFSLNVTSSNLNIFLEPADNSMAFLNAFEVVLVPDVLIQNDAISVPPVQDDNIGLTYRAFETLFRINMGGPLVSYNNDPLWRTWIQDDNYLENKNFTGVVQNRKVVSYAKSVGVATKDDAPLAVYGSCRHIDNPRESFNITWSFDISLGFQYLIRFHFCDIVSEDLGELSFNIYVNSYTVKESLDLEVLSKGRLGTPVFLDFVTPTAMDTNQLVVQIGPPIAYEAQRDGILNGLEIMKLNNYKILAATTASSLVPPSSQSGSGSKNKIRMIVGVTVGSVILFVFVGIGFLFHRRKKSHSPYSLTPETNLTVLASNSATRITLATILHATNHFDKSRVIGKGGFGTVYKGVLDNTDVAVKRGSRDNSQGQYEFFTEIKLLSQFRHKHLVYLVGYCDEGLEMILVYDYMENGTLKSHLYGKEKKSCLSWLQRLEICIGVAKGLHYLHTGTGRTEVENGVVHGDVKSGNILLDKNLNARIADFGLCTIVPGPNQPDVSVEVKGSFGYLDPEYFFKRKLTHKSDIYSFGVVLFEVVCARPAIDNTDPENPVNLVEWAQCLQKDKPLEQIIDPQLQGTINSDCLQEYWNIAGACVAERSIHRPSMGDVLWRLEKVQQLETPLTDEDESVNTANATEIDRGIDSLMSDGENLLTPFISIG
ncbi:hypothetical protein SOVF_125510 [Spinacia oleracea]|uniref:Probable receptor-like protein kinase At5g59700 n=1 Tax=Spinacia oleracea TaxID=3562 RepID=A0ABM3R000_SPIOL|nr:probable receptor-like protein kinase At5g59700 [Spinacia oleracea]XP_021844870.2 probable receptor-like protein kinase At5g59700 [Spinacia oleracea]XP_056688913.1 probable receptor-like protein kinase At5g59700 [Spinacia oleracea]XP_056688914.1 probable receptor-like protein kinase At5g59700 [Spinacia oleracea]XP_056688915.1 probable receptor-like protein kinase At5g59700 [Spinacia oleracea]XP_056688916.1 probable receptor-like protein kinase At5g59700 [Spinacia oleracea]KNA12505.1 hypoth